MEAVGSGAASGEALQRKKRLRAKGRDAPARLGIGLALLGLLFACDGSASSTSTTLVPSTTTTRRATTTTTAPPECPDAFCVRYHIRPEAAWADATPVTADDFAFTLETLIDPDNQVASRDGYSLVSGYEVVDEKTFLLSFSQVYAPWRELFKVVLPAHELEGESFNTGLDEDIGLGSGPFELSEYVQEEEAVLTRNPNFWASSDPASGQALGDVASLTVRIVGDAENQVDGLRQDELDMIYPEPDEGTYDDVTRMGGVEYEVGQGRVWEHIDFNHDDPLLSQRFIREAIARAIDREGVLDDEVRPIDEEAVTLGNTVWLTQQPAYQDHFTEFGYDPEAAEQVLIDNGCTRGEDEVYVCGGQRLSFRWATTAGIEPRERLFEVAQESLSDIGIEVVADFGPATRVFANEFIYGDSSVWQIFNFGWFGGADPSSRDSVYFCEGTASPSGFGDINVNRYCNDEVESLIRQTQTEVDPVARAALYNQADAIYLGDIASIPLYQKPTLLAWNDDIAGPVDNASQAGPLWNVAAWSGKESVVFGVDQGPTTLNVLKRGGDSLAASLVAAAVLQGAYTVAPDFTYVPVLIEDADVIVS